MSIFSGQVAFVTGGARGIGAAVAGNLAAEGAAVMVVDRDAEAAGEIVDKITTNGGKAASHICDLTVEDEVAAAVNVTVERFGGLNIAFNNAGVGGTKGKRTAELELPEWNRIMSINLTSVFLCMKYQLQHMAERGSGVIVNTSSTAGIASAVNSGIAYSASKHGVVGLTKTAAKEYLETGIRINAICPAGVATSLLENTIGAKAFAAVKDSPRIATTKQIADAVLWLVSPSASFYNGQTLVLDGGRSL